MVINTQHDFTKSNNMKNFKKIKKNKGAAMLISVIFFLFISLAIISGLVSPAVREFKISNDLIKSKQSFFLSESGIEDAYYRLKNAKPIGSSTTITLNGSTATTSITDSGYNEKIISSLGDVLARQRKNEIKLSTGTGIAFNYGIQAGEGGFIMNNNAGVNGNVYSNANIIGANNAFISGSAFASGAIGIIDNVDIGENGIGEAHSHEVKNSVVAGNLYCQIGSGNNKPCNTSQTDPQIQPLPITQAMIDQWKIDAENGGIITGNYIVSTNSTLGSKKITGNLAINANLTISGTIYVVGNITTSNNAQIHLSSSYGSTGGIILVDGKTTLNNNVEFFGSGTSGSYVMLVSTNECPTAGCTSSNAIEILNNVGAIIINAQNGTVHLSNNVGLNEVVGKTILMDNGAVINYISGLANSSFTSGPSGGWNIKSWKEVK